MVSGKPCGALVLLDDIALKRRMQSLLEKTMSSNVARAMIDNSDAALGGAMREVSVLFADIRGFTPLAETLGAMAKMGCMLERPLCLQIFTIDDKTE